LKSNLPIVPEAAEYLRAGIPVSPEVLVVLGSGIAIEPSSVEDAVEVPFEKVPGYPSAGVIGHPGRYLAGTVGGRAVLFQRGRFHHYEGHGPAVVSLPIRVAAQLGVKFVILTNVTGGIRQELHPGAIVLIEDHINLQWRNPLVGLPLDGEDRFPDMSAPWDPDLLALASGVALRLGIRITRGCYGAVLGPNFETPAEVRALRTLGADVVGMSTVPELLVARALGLRVLGISLVVNPASGLGDAPLDHEEVLEVSRMGGRDVVRLLREVVAHLP
jgi:purine-nucleoside phosphorylase